MKASKATKAKLIRAEKVQDKRAKAQIAAGKLSPARERAQDKRAQAVIRRAK